MSYREVTAYDWTCDACSSTKLGRDVPPPGWTLSEDGEEHLCPKCSPTRVRWSSRSKEVVGSGLFDLSTPPGKPL